MDSCEPNQAVGDDSLCNGIDEDCADLDEAYRGGMVQNGRGASGSSGIAVCVNGSVESSCEPGHPEEATKVVMALMMTAMGSLMRRMSYSRRFVARAGVAQSRCEEGAVDTAYRSATESDAICNGVDDDCDGLVDEDFREFLTSCGVGACTREVPTRCEDGLLVSNCMAAEPNDSDGTCDNIDDDCDGRVDEGFQVSPVTCGVGACERDGELTCDEGSLVEVCRPGIPSATDDEICDGVDADCDGIVDEDCPDRPLDSGSVSLDGVPVGMAAFQMRVVRKIQPSRLLILAPGFTASMVVNASMAPSSLHAIPVEIVVHR